MRNGLLPSRVLLGLVAAPGQAKAADDKPPAKGLPALIVRTKSIDGLIDDFKYLAELAGKSEEAKQFDEMIKNAGGLEGIDKKKPIALYGHLRAKRVDQQARGAYA